MIALLEVLAQLAAGARGRPGASSAFSPHRERSSRRDGKALPPWPHTPSTTPAAAGTCVDGNSAVAGGPRAAAVGRDRRRRARPQPRGLADAIHARQHLLQTVRAATALATLCVGDEVRINRTVKPRYLHGLVGRVIDIGGQDVTVCLHRPVGRFTSGHIRCSALALERLGAAPATRAA